MRNKLILGILLYFLLTIIGCEKNPSEKEILPKQLTSTNLDSKAYFSPDGKYIVFYTQRNTYIPNVAESPSELWIMNRDGSNQKPLISVDEIYEITSVSIITWLPDSKNILVHIHDYPSYSDYESEIWQIDIYGHKTKLYSPGLRLERPTYSPDLTKTAFIIQGPNPPEGSPIYRLYAANSNFWDTILIEKGIINDYKWKNDSKGFIYSLYDRTNENYDLWESSVNGATKLRISETSENEENLSCSFDGKYIAYSDYKAVYITPTDKFTPILIMDNARLPKWIPNRSLILLYSNQSLGNKSWTESWIVDIHGNIVLKIAEGKFSQVTFSSSGDYFLYTLEGNIWLDYLP